MEGLVDSKLGLASVWPPEALERLASAWIDTPFQLISISISPAGTEILAELTKMSCGDVEILLDKTKSLLTQDEVTSLSTSIDIDDMGLGALKPDR